MIKKNIISALTVMTALSSFSYAELTAPAQLPDRPVQKMISTEDNKLYEQIYSKYKDKFNKLDVSLLENRQELQKQLRAEKTDWKKVETLTKKKADLKAQRELLRYRMRAEMKDNNLRAGYPVRNHHRTGRTAAPRG
ncbi:MAG: hypothetical protein LBV03_07895 [Fusobacteriales bacterium]|nr:hypothetical protein [Fusobacteriales bacterium]